MPRDAAPESCLPESRRLLDLRSDEHGPSTRYRARLSNHLLLQREHRDQQGR